MKGITPGERVIMCGIVGYIGFRRACERVLEGLQRLEYRGYDSSGVAVLDHEGHLSVQKSAGRLANLERRDFGRFTRQFYWYWPYSMGDAWASNRWHASSS